MSFRAEVIDLLADKRAAMDRADAIAEGAPTPEAISRLKQIVRWILSGDVTLDDMREMLALAERISKYHQTQQTLLEEV